MMNPSPIVDRATKFFARCFGRPPQWLAAAPGRVNLIGEHTDYNDGFVLPMAIERFTLLAADRNTNGTVTLHSLTTGETATFSLRGGIKPGQPAWSNYVRGVIAGFQKAGRKITGFDAVIDSTVPYGGGLASSAALEVATATLLEAMGRKPLDPLEKALLCQTGGARIRRGPLRHHGPVHLDTGPRGQRAAARLPVAHNHGRCQ